MKKHVWTEGNMKKLAVIGASCFQEPLISKAKDMGLETHVFAWAADDVGEKIADYFYPISITEKTGKVVAIKAVTDENDLMIINKSGITLRLNLADVRVMGRATQGVKLINLGRRNDTISSVCQVPAEEPDAEESETEIVEEGGVADVQSDTASSENEIK